MTSPTDGTAPSSGTEAVRLDTISFTYGSTLVLQNVSLSVARGAFFTLLGPSGCGKTTLIKVLGGYLAPSAGRCLLGGRDITDVPPESRNIGTVFQQFALFPHLTVWKNVAFGLEVRKLPKAVVAERVESQLHRVRLNREEWQRRPSHLSGGQQQRVALARALAFGPDLLLLDEPLANLDRQLRIEMRGELRRVHRETGATTILVTHDQEEALAASDVIGLMDRGCMLQVGSPREVYERPRTPKVARFLGEANIFPDGTMIRPERLLLGGTRRALLKSVSFFGADQLLEMEENGVPIKLRTATRDSFSLGETISFDVPMDATWKIPEVDDPV